LLNGATTFLHSLRLALATSLVSAIMVGVLAFRVAQTDVALALAAVAVVVLINFYSVLLLHFVTQMFERRMLSRHIEPLTGLLNRHAFYEQVATLIGARSRNDDRHLVVVVVNIDGFSLVTGMSGEAGGKRTRVAVGQRLRESLRRDAIVAHVDDAEFLVAELFTTPDPTPLAERVRRSVTAAPVRMTASIGAVSTPLRPLVSAPPGDVLDEILCIATEAMEEARRDGGNRACHVVSPQLNTLDGPTAPEI
jgi:diguanylate cyclase (GGDEF)-like protein